MAEDQQNAYDLIPPMAPQSGHMEPYEIYHLPKRGKQPVLVGQVTAAHPQEAMLQAARQFRTDKPVYNIWAIRTADIRFTQPEDHDLWLTLPDKKFRDAADYKGGDKLKAFLERTQQA